MWLALFPRSLQMVLEPPSNASFGTVNTAWHGPDEYVMGLKEGVCNPHKKCVVYKRCLWVLSPTMVTYQVKLSFISDSSKTPKWLGDSPDLASTFSYVVTNGIKDRL
jgi:hypothetical protein